MTLNLFLKNVKNAKPCKSYSPQLCFVLLAGKHCYCLRPEEKREQAAADDIATLVSRMWHFPTVAVREDAIAEFRDFLAEVMPAGNRALHFEPLSRVRHAVTYRNVMVLPFRISIAKIPRIRGTKSILLKDFSTLPISNLTRKIARAALWESPAATAKSYTLKL